MPFVQKLVSDGPAEKSGVKQNDVIIRINGIETHSLRKRTIGSLIERFRVHVTIECIEDQDLGQFCYSKIDYYPQTKPGNLRLPRIFKLHGNENGDKVNYIEKTRIMFAVSEYLNFTEEIYSIERDDRLILLNGHKIRTKEKLIEKLAQDTDQLTLTVVDKETETIFDQHNIDITEELVIELHSVQQSLRLNHQSTIEIINQTPCVPPLNGQPGNELIITEPKNVFRPPLPSNEPASPPVPTVPLSTDSSCSENIIAKDKMRLQEKDDSLIDENNKLKYEIENLQRAAKLFSEEVQNELSEKTTTIDALKEGINKQKSEHQRQKSKLKRERREMRNQYEYELGLLTGMNEAIMNQNDQMRDRILQQNAKIQELMERELNSKQILAEMELRLSQPTSSQPFNPGSVHEIETIPVDLSSVFNSNSDGADSDGRNSVERDGTDVGTVHPHDLGQGGSDRIVRNSKGTMQTTQLSDIDENLSESSNSVQL